MAISKRKTESSDKAIKPKQPTTEEQSGSAGRRAATPGRTGKDTGQNRYGQNSAAGPQTETEGQARYRQSGTTGDTRTKAKSNSGSGRADSDETERPAKKPPGAR